jgi:hypothetical protein
MAEKKELPVGRQYRYYVHPKNKPTNNWLAPRFEEIGDKVCSDGKTRYMFTTRDHNLIAYTQRSRREGETYLNFLVFIQEGENGKIDFWPFDAAHPRKKPVQKRKVA